MARKQLGRAASAATDLMTRSDVLALYGQSLGTSGYQKLPSGLILQWGQVTPAAGTATVTFPIAFPAVCAIVQSSPILSGVAAGVTYNSFTLTTSLTGCTLAARSQTGLTTSASNVPLQWLSLGY